MREKIGVMFGNPETTPGGRALKFYCSVRLDIRRMDAIKQGDRVGRRAHEGQGGQEQAGPALPRGGVRRDLRRGHLQGGHRLDAGVEQGLVEKSGTWYTYKNERIGQGRENAKKWLQENAAALSELEAKIRDALGLRPAVAK